VQELPGARKEPGVGSVQKPGVGRTVLTDVKSYLMCRSSLEQERSLVEDLRTNLELAEQF
jgi:hypothetical protein